MSVHSNGVLQFVFSFMALIESIRNVLPTERPQQCRNYTCNCDHNSFSNSVNFFLATTKIEEPRAAPFNLLLCETFLDFFLGGGEEFFQLRFRWLLH